MLLGFYGIRGLVFIVFRELRVFICVFQQMEDIWQGMFGGGGLGSCLIIQLFQFKFVVYLVVQKLFVILQLLICCLGLSLVLGKWGRRRRRWEGGGREEGRREIIQKRGRRVKDGGRSRGRKKKRGRREEGKGGREGGSVGEECGGRRSLIFLQGRISLFV